MGVPGEGLRALPVFGTRVWKGKAQGREGSRVQGWQDPRRDQLLAPRWQRVLHGVMGRGGGPGHGGHSLTADPPCKSPGVPGRTPRCRPRRRGARARSRLAARRAQGSPAGRLGGPSRAGGNHPALLQNSLHRGTTLASVQSLPRGSGARWPVCVRLPGSGIRCRVSASGALTGEHEGLGRPGCRRATGCGPHSPLLGCPIVLETRPEPRLSHAAWGQRASHRCAGPVSRPGWDSGPQTAPPAAGGQPPPPTRWAPEAGTPREARGLPPASPLGLPPCLRVAPSRPSGSLVATRASTPAAASNEPAAPQAPEPRRVLLVLQPPGRGLGLSTQAQAGVPLCFRGGDSSGQPARALPERLPSGAWAPGLALRLSSPLSGTSAAIGGCPAGLLPSPSSASLGSLPTSLLKYLCFHFCLIL